jgi:hypothetical protein
MGELSVRGTQQLGGGLDFFWQPGGRWGGFITAKIRFGTRSSPYTIYSEL